MLSIILTSLAIALGINIVLFLIAFRLKSDKLTDISYALSFLSLNIVALYYATELNGYSWLLFLMVTLWGIRIGGFLLMRVLKVGKDRRFDEMRDDFVRFGKFWVAQAITAWILMLPVTLAQYRGDELSALAWLGVVIWLIGLVVEALADSQKFAFKQNASNKGKWIQSGVWKYSRHPNYFGEISVWVGIYLYCFSALNGLERVIGLSSPLLIAAVLLFVSGVPILEQNADKKWGKLKAYRDYKNRTRLLLPLPKFSQTK